MFTLATVDNFSVICLYSYLSRFFLNMHILKAYIFTMQAIKQAREIASLKEQNVHLGHSAAQMLTCLSHIRWMPVMRDFEPHQALVESLRKKIYPYCSVLVGSRNKFVLHVKKNLLLSHRI